jgi:hypothetical protein
MGRQRTNKRRPVVKKVLPFAVAALMIPGVALAKGPQQGTHTNNGKAKVMYVLKGTLSAFSPYNSSTGNGSITIAVTHSNRHGKALVGTSLTFTGMVASNTKVVLPDGITVITDGDRGIVKLRAPKEPRDISASDLAAVLTALPIRQIIDQGASSS